MTLYPDGLDRLVEYDTAVSTRFVYDGIQAAAEVDNPAGTIQKRYVWGDAPDELIVQYDGSGTSNRRFIGADERGSVISLTDSAGGLVGINRYDEFGKPAATNIGRFQYTGQMWLPEAGVSNYKARAYAPHLGRFMQADPIGYEGGLNLYAYVLNDPANFIDPFGLSGEENGDDSDDDPDETLPPIIVTAYRTVSITFVSGGRAVANTTVLARDALRYPRRIGNYVEQSKTYYENRLVRIVFKQVAPVPAPTFPTPPKYENKTLDTRVRDIQTYYASQRGWYDNWKNRFKGVIDALGDFFDGIDD